MTTDLRDPINPGVQDDTIFVDKETYEFIRQKVFFFLSGWTGIDHDQYRDLSPTMSPGAGIRDYDTTAMALYATFLAVANAETADNAKKAVEGMKQIYDAANDPRFEPLERFLEAANDAEFDAYKKWVKVVGKFVPFGGSVVAAFSVYELYENISWIQENTQGWTDEEIVNSLLEFSDITPVIFGFMSKLAALFQGTPDEVVFDESVETWNPPKVGIKVSNGWVKVEGGGDTIEVIGPANPAKEGAWIDDLREAIRKEADKNIPTVHDPWKELDIDPRPDIWAPPGVRVDVGVDYGTAGQPKLSVRLRRYTRHRPNQARDPAEEWRQRMDSKSASWYAYRGLLRLVNRTWGELDEIRDLWEAFGDNVGVTLSNGEFVLLGDLSASEAMEALQGVVDGDNVLAIDGDQLIIDLATMELTDRLIGTLSQKEREWIQNEGIRGIADSGNFSTWFNRVQKMQESIMKTNESKPDPGD